MIVFEHYEYHKEMITKHVHNKKLKHYLKLINNLFFSILIFVPNSIPNILTIK